MNTDKMGIISTGESIHRRKRLPPTFMESSSTVLKIQQVRNADLCLIKLSHQSLETEC